MADVPLTGRQIVVSARTERWSALLVLPLFVVTIFLGATLVFLVQPMAVKALLPSFGGSAAVWNTAMVFFQAALLAGYWYAFSITRPREARRPTALHLAVLASVTVVFLPRLAAVQVTQVTERPVLTLLGQLLATVGIPFIVVAAAGPLLQRWFSTTGHARADDPYFLYAAGNVGSIGGLLAYPILIEPRLTLDQQYLLWRSGFIGFAVLSAACAIVVLRSRAVSGTSTPAVAMTLLSWRRRLRWLGLAAVPAALMLGVTNHLATDVASVPMLWVLPLVIYLLSYVIAFGGLARVATLVCWVALPTAAVVVAIDMVVGLELGLAPQIGAHLVLLACAATAAHSALAADRPPTDRLTEFYVMLSVGGLAGGTLTALVAPQLFDGVTEYPLAIVASLLVIPLAARRRRRAGERVSPVARWLGPIAVVCVSVLFVMHGYAATVGLVHADRSFYGVHRVNVRDGSSHFLTHGTTLHGAQHLRAPLEDEPLGYYHRSSPIADVMTKLSGGGEDIAVIGLGVGSLAAYGDASQHWTFFDIDASIARTAQTPEYFTHLSRSAAPIDIQIADGRLGVAGLPDASQDLVVLDAFTSDAIPVHLLTQEALSVYRAKLKASGLIAVHISNRYLDLAPVIAATARSSGLTAHVWHDKQEPDDRFKSISSWVVLAEGPAPGDLGLSSRWRPVAGDVQPWSDDFSDLWSAIDWRRGLKE